jgi:hypothetical protein
MIAQMRWQVEPGWDALDGMVRLSQMVVERDPRKADNWRALVLALYQAGQVADIAETLGRAAAALGDDASGRKSFIRLLLASNEPDRAAAEAEALLAVSPQDSEVLALLKSALTEAGARDRLRELGIGRDEILQVSRFSLKDEWEMAKSETELQALVARCRAVLAGNPADAGARCFLAHGLAQLGEQAEAAAVMTTAELISIAELNVPAQLGSRESFCAALADEIRRNPTLAPDPRHKATRNGLQAARIGIRGETALDALLHLIKQAVDDYARARRVGGDTYFTAPISEVRLSSWAVIFNGTTGHQTAHMHPSGWLSGVFYVTAPKEPGTGRYSGPLLAGAALRRLSVAAPWESVPVEPVPGRIVLFPSFLPHATEPCKIPQERICVAFDVIPTEARQTLGDAVAA